MPRRNLKSTTEHRELNENLARGGTKIEIKRGHSYQVHYSARSRVEYKCPGCNKIIPIGSATFTVIDADHIFGPQAALDERRHWHQSCWRSFR